MRATYEVSMEAEFVGNFCEGCHCHEQHLISWATHKAKLGGCETAWLAAWLIQWSAIFVPKSKDSKHPMMVAAVRWAVWTELWTLNENWKLEISFWSDGWWLSLSFSHHHSITYSPWHCQANRKASRKKRSAGLIEAASCPMRCCRAPELASGCVLRRLKQRMILGDWFIDSLIDITVVWHDMIAYHHIDWLLMQIIGFGFIMRFIDPILHCTARVQSLGPGLQLYHLRMDSNALFMQFTAELVSSLSTETGQQLSIFSGIGPLLERGYGLRSRPSCSTSGNCHGKSWPWPTQSMSSRSWEHRNAFSCMTMTAWWLQGVNTAKANGFCRKTSKETMQVTFLWDPTWSVWPRVSLWASSRGHSQPGLDGSLRSGSVNDPLKESIPWLQRCTEGRQLPVCPTFQWSFGCLTLSRLWLAIHEHLVLRFVSKHPGNSGFSTPTFTTGALTQTST